MKQKNKRKALKTFILTSVLVPLFSVFSFAEMTDKELATFYWKNNTLLSEKNFGTMIFRLIGFKFNYFLAYIGDKASIVYDKAFTLVDFSSNPTINNMIEQFKPVYVWIMTISLVALGVLLIVSHDKKPKIWINIMIAVLCITSSTTIFGELNSLAVKGKDAIEHVSIQGSYTDDDKSSHSYMILGNNMYDLSYIYNKKGDAFFKNMDYEYNKDKIPTTFIKDGKTAKNIDYNETMVMKKDNPYGIEKGTNTWQILSHKSYLPVNTDDWYKIEKIETGKLSGTFSENTPYYRYNMNYMSCTFELLALCLLYILMAYKVIRILYELVFSRFLVMLYSAELHSGQKIMKVLTFVRDSYILLMFTALSIKLYLATSSYLTRMIDDATVRGFLTLFVAMAVLDGPNLVERILGMDLGLRSLLGTLYAGGRAVAGAGRMAIRTGGLAKRTGEKMRANRSDKMANSETDKGNELNTSMKNGNEVNKSGGANAEEQLNNTLGGSNHSNEDGNSFDANSIMDKNGNDISTDAGSDESFNADNVMSGSSSKSANTGSNNGSNGSFSADNVMSGSSSKSANTGSNNGSNGSFSADNVMSGSGSKSANRSVSGRNINTKTTGSNNTFDVSNKNNPVKNVGTNTTSDVYNNSTVNPNSKSISKNNKSEGEIILNGKPYNPTELEEGKSLSDRMKIRKNKDKNK